MNGVQPTPSGSLDPEVRARFPDDEVPSEEHRVGAR